MKRTRIAPSIAVVALAGLACGANAASAGGVLIAAGGSPTAKPSPTVHSDPTVDPKTTLPRYPDAVAHSSGASRNGMSGTLLSTHDAFEKVYEWYKGKMPAGSEKSKLTATGISTATFEVVRPSGKGTVTITTQHGKTTIALLERPS